MGLSYSEKEAEYPKVTIVEIEEGRAPQRKRRNITSSARRLARRTFFLDNDHQSPWPRLVRWGLLLLTGAITLAVITVILYHSLLLVLVRTFSPPRPSNNGLQTIIRSWKGPSSTMAWTADFSRDVEPKAIHSHNDYWRRVPLFEALSLGVTGVEADCHLVNGEIVIGHTGASLTSNRTLDNLYLNPLSVILENQNAGNGIASSKRVRGVWDVAPSRSMILMTDLKTEGHTTLAAVQAQLEPYRQRGWLTYWNGSAIVPGPITHISTGTTPFDAVLNSTFANATYRDVFFDAPLDRLTDAYSISNSYYSSASMTAILGGKRKISARGLSDKQMQILQAQIDKANSLGLVSRYWDIPSWPVSRRTIIWKQLESMGIGMLNVDAIEEAARWNWNRCNILGLELC